MWSTPSTWMEGAPLPSCSMGPWPVTHQITGKHTRVSFLRSMSRPVLDCVIQQILSAHYVPGPGCSSPSLLPVPTLLLLSKSQPNVRSSEHSSPTLPRASQWFAAAKKSRPHSTTPHLYFDICFLACWPPALLGRKLREHSLRAWHILSNSVGKICEPKGHSA